MKRTFLILLLAFICMQSFGQVPGDKRQLKIVDTLSVQERNTRVPVLTRMEADSIAQVYNAAHPVVMPPAEKVLVSEVPLYWLIAIAAALLILVVMVYISYTQQKQLRHENHGLASSLRRLNDSTIELMKGEKAGTKNALKTGDGKTKEQEKYQSLDASFKLLQKEYEDLKKEITANFKIKNYPASVGAKSEADLLRSLFETEKVVTSYSYENFVKPINAIADANKNNPSKISDEDADKIVSLLSSLSLLYIEYLYLRVNDLAIGGHIAERIASLRNGKSLNPEWLKKLNTEHGSRPLVLKLALDKKDINGLIYPVFEETDLTRS